MAKALDVRVEDLLVTEGRLAERPGPVGEVQRVFDEVRKLPRSQQRRIVETVDALVQQFKRNVG
jgi:hypothetical protein